MSEELDTLKARLFDAKEQIKSLTIQNDIMEKALWDIGTRAKPIMNAMEADMKHVAADALEKAGKK